MIEAKPKVNQLQRYVFYPKVAEICEKWEDISSRIQVCICFSFLNGIEVHLSVILFVLFLKSVLSFIAYSLMAYFLLYTLTIGICNACAC